MLNTQSLQWPPAGGQVVKPTDSTPGTAAAACCSLLKNAGDITKFLGYAASAG